MYDGDFDDGEEGHAVGHQFSDARAALAFIEAGNARVTIVSVKTGARFSYKIRKSEDGRVTFVSLLTGTDNENGYRYLGILKNGEFRWTVKSCAEAKAKSVLAFEFAWKNLKGGRLPPNVEVWHEGRCGKCGRVLTVPESIASGIGPVCAEKMGE